MKVAFLGSVEESFVEYVQELGYETEKISKEDIGNNNYSRDFEILCGSMLFERMDLREFENLKYIFLYSQGIDYLPLDYIKEKEIILCNNKGAYAEPIGEFIVYSLLAMEKYARTNIENQQNKIWKRRAITGNLYNKKAVFLGTGDIAQEAAKRLSGFDLEIIGYNTNGRDVEYFNKCVNLENLNSELNTADYVVLVLPSTEKTKYFVNEDLIKEFKDGAKFINISRGDVVDEKALIKYLEKGKIASAALDVFEEEPLSEESPLWDMENVYITPHISGTAEDNYERFVRCARKNLENLKENKELINIVDLDRKY
ncbi:NAD(P)-dependent oxidoreductase [Peptoniphilus stercorisuis]|uniref:Phosphoglycerate dehydrogenase-like enzyme n=1 Tax=Peptoniphilus stercorisuis TaxID=1436965 RepID=A0ABS4KDB3_9FIRM|nr:NAD(P)-dependent oxidoreductase [Peptoniphilus stercorisuis]MBP2024604.1 phosphoglycerate dehydrogenase-like enzyme [Peptoniphilus stercorisuis]